MKPFEHAESSRVQGKYAQVPSDKGGECMKAWRVRATTYGSMSTQTPNGNDSAEFLHQEREILKTYYADPAVIFSAREESTPSDLLLPEMYRDWGLYLEKLTALTGNSVYLGQSIIAFNKAIELSPLESSAHNLATIEMFGVNRRRGEKGTFSELKKVYRNVIKSDVGGWDRKAAVSVMYIAESKAQKRIDGIIEGSVNLAKALHTGRRQDNISPKEYRQRGKQKREGQVLRRQTFTWGENEIKEKLELPKIN